MKQWQRYAIIAAALAVGCSKSSTAPTPLNITGSWYGVADNYAYNCTLQESGTGVTGNCNIAYQPTSGQPFVTAMVGANSNGQVTLTSTAGNWNQSFSGSVAVDGKSILGDIGPFPSGLPSASLVLTRQG